MENYKLQLRKEIAMKKIALLQGIITFLAILALYASVGVAALVDVEVLNRGLVVLVVLAVIGIFSLARLATAYVEKKYNKRSKKLG